MTRPILHALVRSLSFTTSSAFQRSLFSATFLVAFYSLFCIGELATKSTRSMLKVVQYSNLTFLLQDQPHAAQITISEYKHNLSKRPFDILLARVRWPTTVTAKINTLWQKKITHAKKKRQQKEKRRGKKKNPAAKRKRLTAKRKTSRQKEKPRGKKKKTRGKKKNLAAKRKRLTANEYTGNLLSIGSSFLKCNMG